MCYVYLQEAPNSNYSYNKLDIDALIIGLVLLIIFIFDFIRKYNSSNKNYNINQIILPHHICHLVLENEKICAICWDPLVLNYFITKCGHMFHKYCIYKIQQNKCPKCRSELA